MARKQPNFDLLAYLAASSGEHNGYDEPDRIPPLNELSKSYGVSIASLREQLEVARALGIVEVRPRTGIRRLEYTFAPAVHESLSYAIALDRENFEKYSDLRKHIETAYWHQAVAALTDEDRVELDELVEHAWSKLHGDPVQIPHQEHRQLHLTIYRRLDNPFVVGMLEAYWDAYEQIGLNRFEGLEYLESVWAYHRRMVAAIVAADYDSGYQALIEHMELIYRRPGG
ncbi:MAG: FCD domain-containing protein [Anaerolineae bacterium]|nr:FCD domain-containing protein [Anaerolineae bacterium]